jgi:hypothetical protein
MSFGEKRHERDHRTPGTAIGRQELEAKYPLSLGSFGRAGAGETFAYGVMAERKTDWVASKFL